MARYDKETKFYWLQLKEDFFEDDAIEWLEEQKPNGRDYAYFYLKLCLKSLKSNGILIRQVGNILIPYDNKKLAELTRMDFDTVTVAMELLKQIGLIKILENGEIYLTQLENLIGSTSRGAFKKQIQLAKRKRKDEQIIQALENKQNIKEITKNINNTEEDDEFVGLPKLIKCKRLSREQILLPTGITVYVDEKRYGGNGGLAYERANGLCEDCGKKETLRIHHENGYSNNLEDLIILCEECHGIHHSQDYLDKLNEWKEGGKNSTKVKDKDKVKDKVKVNNITYYEKLLSTNKYEIITGNFRLEEAIKDWLRYKQERKELYKEIGLQSLLTQIEKQATTYGEQQVIDLITECMANNYKGIIFDKLKNKPKRKQGIEPEWLGKEIKKEKFSDETERLYREVFGDSEE